MPSVPFSREAADGLHADLMLFVGERVPETDGFHPVLASRPGDAAAGSAAAAAAGVAVTAVGG